MGVSILSGLPETQVFLYLSAEGIQDACERCKWAGKGALPGKCFFKKKNENYPIQKGLFCGWFQEQLLETAHDTLDPQQVATHHYICHVNYNFITGIKKALTFVFPFIPHKGKNKGMHICWASTLSGEY